MGVLGAFWAFWAKVEKLEFFSGRFGRVLGVLGAVSSGRFGSVLGVLGVGLAVVSASGVILGGDGGAQGPEQVLPARLRPHEGGLS